MAEPAVARVTTMVAAPSASATLLLARAVVAGTPTSPASALLSDLSHLAQSAE